jgi:hypothetical protein
MLFLPTSRKLWGAPHNPVLVVWGGFVPNLEHHAEIGCVALAFYSSFVPRNLKPILRRL